MKRGRIQPWDDRIRFTGCAIVEWAVEKTAAWRDIVEDQPQPNGFPESFTGRPWR